MSEVTKAKLTLLCLCVALILNFSQNAFSQTTEIGLDAADEIKVARLAPGATTTSSSFPVGDATKIRVHIFSTSNNFTINITCPNSQIINKSNVDTSFNGTYMAYTVNQDLSAFMPAPEFQAGTHFLFEFPTQGPGGYTVNLQAPSNLNQEIAVMTRVLTDSNLRAKTVIAEGNILVGKPVIIQTLVFDAQSVVSNANVNVRVLKPSGNFSNLVLKDDGLEPDITLGDGVYTGIFLPSEAGQHAVTSKAAGNKLNGSPYELQTTAEFVATPGNSRLTGSVTDLGIDVDSDQLIEKIVVKANTETTVSGDYGLFVHLKTNNGKYLVSSNYTQLQVGSGEIAVEFEANSFLELGENGPYTIELVELVGSQDSGSPSLDTLQNIGQTQAYTLSQMQRPKIIFTGQNTVIPIDTNSNSKYEVLKTSVGVNLLNAGNYRWKGNLVDSNNKVIDSFSGNAGLTAGVNQILFTFQGFKIFTNGVSGIYQLRNVILWNASGDSIIVDKVLETPNYTFNQFESSLAITSGGALVTVATTVPDQNTQLVFNGTANQHILINLSNNTIPGTTKVSLLKPGGTQHSSMSINQNSTGSIEIINLPMTGVYTILIDPSGANVGNIDVQVIIVNDVITPITPGGAPVTVSATQPGQNTRLTFNGNSNQHIFISLNNNTIPGTTNVSLFKPDNTVMRNLSIAQNGTASIDMPYLPVTGTYTILVDPSGTNAGNIQVQVGVVIDIATTVTPGGSPLTVTTTQVGQNALLTFNGSAGQKVFVDLDNNSIPGVTTVNLLKPDGAILGETTVYQNGASYIDTKTLPMPGVYTILIDPSETNTGSIRVRLYSIVDINGTITPGGPLVTGTITQIGQNALLTFDGTAGQKVFINKPNLLGLVSLIKPDGTILETTYTDFLDTTILPVTGVYTILVDPSGRSTGIFNIQLYNVPPDVSENLVPNTPPSTITITSPGQNAQLTFGGTAGQHVLINLSNNTIPEVTTVRLLKSDGTQIGTAYIGQNGVGTVEIPRLPEDGIYTILVNPWGASTGSIKVQLDVLGDVLRTIIPNGSPVTTTTTTSNTNAQINFSGSANHHILINFADNTFPAGVTVFLIDPNGTEVGNTDIAYGGTGIIDLFELPLTGTYNIIIDPPGISVGSITAIVSDLSQPRQAAGKLVYSSLDSVSGKKQIFILNANGTGKTNISNSTTDDIDAVLSPNGGKIAFSRNGLSVMNANGSNQRTLTGAYIWAAALPSWSPDNSKIVFKDWGATPDLFVINVDGTGRTQVTNNVEHEECPKWSPDGSKIAFGKGNSVYLINPDGTGETLVWTGTYPPSCVIWSPNGQSLAWTGWYTGELIVTQADGSNLRTLILPLQTQGAMSWSPDSTKIAYSGSHYTTNWGDDVFVVNASGGTPTQITYLAHDGSGGIRNIIWSPDGTQIAYAYTVNATASSELYAVNADRSNWGKISQESVDNVRAMWFPQTPTPFVEVTAPLNVTALLAGSNIPVEAVAVNFARPITKVEFYLDSTKLGEDFTAPYNFVWTNAVAGTYALTAKATDNQSGITISAAVNIKVNAPPAVSISTPLNNAVFNAPANIAINANVSSADTTITKVEFYRGTTKLGEDATAPYSYNWNNSAAGSYALTAKVIDNLGVSTTSTAVNVKVNALPAVSITAPTNNASFTAPATVTINASASDTDGTIAKVEFFRASTKLGESTVAPYSFVWTNAAAGTYSLTAKATDSDGAVKTSTAITIKVNATPNTSITAPANNANFTAPASITINASASDSDGTISKVEFYQGATKLGQDTSSPYSFVWTNTPAGTYSLTAVATDNLGATKTSAVINIRVNAQPAVSITAPANNANFTAPASVTINANATDADGTITKVEFYQAAAKLGEDTTAPYNFAWTNAAAGTYSLTAKATDNSGGTKTSVAVSIKVNALPTASITAPLNNVTFTAPATVTINASASDTDGTITKVEFYRGATKLGEDLTAPYSYVWSSVPAGAYSLTVKSTDNSGGTKTSAAINITIN